MGKKYSMVIIEKYPESEIDVGYFIYDILWRIEKTNSIVDVSQLDSYKVVLYVDENIDDIIDQILKENNNALTFNFVYERYINHTVTTSNFIYGSLMSKYGNYITDGSIEKWKNTVMMDYFIKVQKDYDEFMAEK